MKFDKVFLIFLEWEKAIFTHKCLLFYINSTLYPSFCSWLWASVRDQFLTLVGRNFPLLTEFPIQRNDVVPMPLRSCVVRVFGKLEGSTFQGFTILPLDEVLQNCLVSLLRRIVNSTVESRFTKAIEVFLEIGRSDVQVSPSNHLVVDEPMIYDACYVKELIKN